MKKFFDNLLYFFGYAPITLRHEVIYSHIVKESEFDILRKARNVSMLDFKGIEHEMVVPTLEKELLEEARKYIITKAQKDVFDDIVKVVATISVGRIK